MMDFDQLDDLLGDGGDDPGDGDPGGYDPGGGDPGGYDPGSYGSYGYGGYGFGGGGDPGYGSYQPYTPPSYAPEPPDPGYGPAYGGYTPFGQGYNQYPTDPNGYGQYTPYGTDPGGDPYGQYSPNYGQYIPNPPYQPGTDPGLGNPYINQQNNQFGQPAAPGAPAGPTGPVDPYTGGYSNYYTGGPGGGSTGGGQSGYQAPAPGAGGYQSGFYGNPGSGNYPSGTGTNPSPYGNTLNNNMPSDWGPNQTGYQYAALGQNNSQFQQNLGQNAYQFGVTSGQNQQQLDNNLLIAIGNFLNQQQRLGIDAYTAQQNAAIQFGQNAISAFTAQSNAAYQQGQTGIGQYNAQTQRELGMGNLGFNYAQLGQQNAQFGGSLGFQYAQLGQQGQNQQAQNQIAGFIAQQNALYQQGQLDLGTRDRNIAEFTAQTQAQLGMGNLGVSQFTAQSNAAYQQAQSSIAAFTAQQNALVAQGQLSNEQARTNISAFTAQANATAQQAEVALRQQQQQFEQGPQFQAQMEQQRFNQALQAGQFGLQANQQGLDEQFRRGQLISQLRGPKDVYVEQNVIHGMNDQGISNAEAAINGTGGDVARYGAPQARPEAVSYQSFMREAGMAPQGGQQMAGWGQGASGGQQMSNWGAQGYGSNSYAGGYGNAPGYPPQGSGAYPQPYGPGPGGASTAPVQPYGMERAYTQQMGVNPSASAMGVNPLAMSLEGQANDAQAAAQQAYYRENPTMPGGAQYQQGPMTPGTGGYGAFGGPVQQQAPPGYVPGGPNGTYVYAAGAYRSFWDPRTGQTSANSGGAGTELGQYDWQPLVNAQQSAVQGVVGGYMTQHPNVMPPPEQPMGQQPTGTMGMAPPTDGQSAVRQFGGNPAMSTFMSQMQQNQQPVGTPMQQIDGGGAESGGEVGEPSIGQYTPMAPYQPQTGGVDPMWGNNPQPYTPGIADPRSYNGTGPYQPDANGQWNYDIRDPGFRSFLGMGQADTTPWSQMPAPQQGDPGGPGQYTPLQMGTPPPPKAVGEPTGDPLNPTDPEAERLRVGAGV